LAARRAYRYDPLTALKLLSIPRLPNHSTHLDGHQSTEPQNDHDEKQDVDDDDLTRMLKETGFEMVTSGAYFTG
jgi:hypothetical protein